MWQHSLNRKQEGGSRCIGDFYPARIGCFSPTRSGCFNPALTGHYIYYYSDTMQIKNWPLEGLIVEKQVDSDDSTDKDQYYTFRISILNDNGEVNTEYNEENGDDQFEDGVVEFELKDREQKMFWGFEKGTRYKVEETFEGEEGNKFTTTVGYNVYDEDGNITEYKTETKTYHAGTLTQEDEVVVFTNMKVASEGEVKVQKVLEGRDWTTDDSFEFTITPVGDAPAFEPNTVNVTKDSVDYTESFGKVTFTKAGTYEWTISETHKGETIDGVAYASADKTVTIEVVDDGSGNLVAADGSALVQTVEFRNTYSASGESEVRVRKTLSGRDWTTEDSFEFTITPVGEAPAFEPNTVTVTKDSADYTESFGKVKFTKAGTYEWTVSETHKGETIDGVAYASADKTVSIVVVDDGHGHLVADEQSMLVQTAEFTNSYSASGEGEVKVQKVLEGRDWTDDDEFTFTISADEGVPMPGVTEITITKADADQTKSFGKIAFTEADEYTYTVKETRGDLSGITYDETEHPVTIKVIDDGNGHLVAEEGDTLIKTEKITNTYTPENVTVSGEKMWDLQGYDESLMSDSIKVYIKDGDTTVDTLTVKAGEDGKWTFTSKELPKYRADGKTEIIYTVDEEVPKGFAKVVTGNNIKNTYQPEFTKIMVEKTWVNADGSTTWPEGVTVEVQLTADGAAVKEKTAKLDAKNTSYTFEKLPKYQADGTTEIAYSVKEVKVAGYSSTVGVLTAGKITVTNTQETTKIKVEKIWKDASGKTLTWPEGVKVTVDLYEGDVKIRSVTLDQKNPSAVFDNLPIHEGKTYSVKEGVISGTNDTYKTVVEQSQTEKGKFTITNTLVEQPETTQIKVTKVWSDNNNSDVSRPGYVDIKVMANGSTVRSGQLNAANSWTMTFTDLPKYTGSGKDKKEIAYTVEETAVAGYTASYKVTNAKGVTGAGNTLNGGSVEITNKHEPEKTTPPPTTPPVTPPTPPSTPTTPVKTPTPTASASASASASSSTASASSASGGAVSRPAGGSGTTSAAPTASVKTGDETPINLYLVLMLAAAAVILEELIRRRRKNKEASQK